MNGIFGKTDLAQFWSQIASLGEIHRWLDKRKAKRLAKRAEKAQSQQTPE
jgi:hypothetical protein